MILKQKNILFFLLIVFCSFSLFLCTGCKKKTQIKEEPVDTMIVEEEVEPSVPDEPVEPPEIEEEEETVDILEPEEIDFEMIHFDFDRYNLKPEARAILSESADILKENFSIYLLIEGHCDERGTIEYNLQLGK